MLDIWISKFVAIHRTIHVELFLLLIQLFRHLTQGKLNFLLACSSYTYKSAIFPLPHTHTHTHIQAHTSLSTRCVFKMLRNTSGMTSLEENNEYSSSQRLSTNSFRSTAPAFILTSVFYIFICGDTSKLNSVFSSN